MVKTRVAVLRGGPSDEYEVSLKSGASVLDALRVSSFEPIDIVITRDGEWLLNGFPRYPEQILAQVDVVFNAMHGSYGEDGTVQRILDRHNVRYTGSKAFSSRIAMHKVLTKDYLRETGIKMAPHVRVTQDSIQTTDSVARMISDLFGPQYVVKPVSSGSSVGTVLVESALYLPKVLREGLAAFPELIVEKCIQGKEATCGVIERYRGEQLYAFPPIEIVPPADVSFFNYDAKYSGVSEEICPGRFSYEEKKEIERIARTAHTILGLSQYSRTDCIVAKDGVYFLEVNTLPGLTSESLFPKAVNAVGDTYERFIAHLVEDTLEPKVIMS